MIFESDQNNKYVSSFTVPNRPENLREDSAKRTTTSITISWDAPSAPSNPDYYIEWFKGSSKAGSQTTDQLTTTLSGLDPGQSYNISVYAVSNGIKSEGINETLATSK